MNWAGKFCRTLIDSSELRSANSNLRFPPMQIRLRIEDHLTEPLRARLARCADTTPLAVAAAMELKSWAERAFDEPGKRPSAWAARKRGGGHPLLKEHGLLWRSFRVSAQGAGVAQIATDRPYAAVHQFGSKPKAAQAKQGKAAKPSGGGIPARPYFPFDASGNLMPAAAALMMATISRRLQGILDGKA